MGWKVDGKLGVVFGSELIPFLHYRSYIKETQNFLLKSIVLFE